MVFPVMRSFSFTCVSIGNSFVLNLHFQTGAGTFGKWVISAWHELGHDFAYDVPEGFCITEGSAAQLGWLAVFVLQRLRLSRLKAMQRLHFHERSPFLRVYQRRATFLVISSPRWVLPSFRLLRHSLGWSARTRA